MHILSTEFASVITRFTIALRRALYPFHNWLPTALKQLAIVNLAIRKLRPVSSVVRCIAFVLWAKVVALGRFWLLNMFKIQRQHLEIQIVALGLTNIRTRLHNVVLTRDSVARISKVARWFAPLYERVVRPRECCNTCRRWFCNLVLPLHVTCPPV